LQGATSTTFSHPPFDDSLTVPELFAYHAANSPNHPLFVYPDERTKLTTIYYPEAFRAICKAAKFVSGHYKRSVDMISMPLAVLIDYPDAITFFSLIVGIMHLGLIPFAISTRNSAAGVAHLTKKT
ncbi:hypothetical protein BKA93DRAFT_697934, partial [Sparassis latifolia]